MTTGILIAAAGRGERFVRAGGQGNKLNAEFADAAGLQRPLFEHTLRQALASGLPVRVVTRPDNLQVQRVCGAYQVPVTLLASAALGESIAAGVAATPHWRGWLVHLADMPFVTPDIFLLVADALQRHPIVRPCVGQLPGHPVGFSALLRKSLCRLRGDNGARALLQEEAVYLLPLDRAGVVQDIDLPSQLPASE
ncbi:molybdenum hydroxylase accessory protein, YgfJ family [Serratia ficaria]|uniref:nucleotidyltransferase family protein n=1 Tax=Serratia ficaria TaxID=61651 RepID=UPI0021787878|nr:nucleotidyltransferase family protein [Serratia ficaria]CAI0793643.1 molybdenum hydroxylase accessory protein, YgfJ family [Serratia ficaria]CAI1592780.1 molybdenum hydroxylase accessory protein, YgfJ family [Serratia ficaria]CAI2411359.1 molybdenum hydroxylase accessory protein, YgfJ family [Serratia ficaria]CAI2787135.1 molybdenum hydroxylase accessory protein, YgfJ family [Serratia ficaria]